LIPRLSAAIFCVKSFALFASFAVRVLDFGFPITAMTRDHGDLG